MNETPEIDNMPHSRRRITLGGVVVLLIVGIGLLGLLLPAICSAREAARRNSCICNLKQFGLAVLNYESSHRQFPPGNAIRDVGQVTSAAGTFSTYDGINWVISILPQMEEANLYSKYNRSEWNESPANREVCMTRVSGQRCPSDRLDTNTFIPASGPGGETGLKQLYAFGSYRAMSGRSDGFQFLDNPDVVGYPRKWRGVMHVVGVHGFEQEKSTDIKDGGSKTFLVGESASRTNLARHTFWAYSYASYSLSAATPQSRTLQGDYDACVAAGGQGGDEPCKRGWGGSHPGAFNMSFCDGAVRPIPYDIDLAVFAALSTIDGGEAGHYME